MHRPTEHSPAVERVISFLENPAKSVWYSSSRMQGTPTSAPSAALVLSNDSSEPPTHPPRRRERDKKKGASFSGVEWELLLNVDRVISWGAPRRRSQLKLSSKKYPRSSSEKSFKGGEPFCEAGGPQVRSLSGSGMSPLVFAPFLSLQLIVGAIVPERSWG